MAIIVGLVSILHLFYFFFQKKEVNMSVFLSSASSVSFIAALIKSSFNNENLSESYSYMLFFLLNSSICGVIIFIISIRATSVKRSVFSKRVETGGVFLIAIFGAVITFVLSLLLGNNVPYCESANCTARLRVMAMEYDAFVLYAFSFFAAFVNQGVVARICASVINTRSH